jgi:hypothetical protein
MASQEIEGRLYVMNLNHMGLPVRNDPDFLHFPFTWGVCRPDIRKSIEAGDFACFATGRNDPNGQRIVGIIEVEEKMDWKAARQRFPERIWKSTTSGNILVSASGEHLKGAPHPPEEEGKYYERRIGNYSVGSIKGSVFLNDNNTGGLKLTRKRLDQLLGKGKEIPRPGVRLVSKQVQLIMKWVKDSNLPARRGPLKNGDSVLRSMFSKECHPCSE